jgi:hypothetical protein
MNVPISTPAFEARHLCLASGWYVRVAWPNGKRDHIPGFVSQQEAERWIAEKAQAWLSMQNQGAGATFGDLQTDRIIVFKSQSGRSHRA